MNVQFKRNETRRLLSNTFNTTEGVLKYNVHNKKLHELAKFFIGWELKEQKIKFVMEAVFLNGQRTDILELDTNTAIEILHTETKEACEQKSSTYPTDNVIMLDAMDVIKKHMEGLND